jgi:hypothetical protein
VPARVNVQTPAQLPAVGAPGNRSALGEVPPVVCWHERPPCAAGSKSTLCCSVAELVKVTVPPVTMLALVVVPLPAVRWNMSMPSTVLNDAVDGGSTPCAIEAVSPPAAASATVASAMRNLCHATFTSSLRGRSPGGFGAAGRTLGYDSIDALGEADPALHDKLLALLA